MKTISLTAVSFLVAVLSAQADWMAGQDFIANEKPDGPQELVNPNFTVPAWSYGYRFTLATTSLALWSPGEHNNAILGHADMEGYNSSYAALAVNTGSSPFLYNFGPGPLLPIFPGEIYLHPHPGDSFAVVRWTVPSSDTYDVNASWDDIDPYGGNGGSGNIVVNGITTFSQVFANGGGVSAINSLTLNAGDIVDFATGSNGDYGYDSTRFNATIIVVPEPSSLLVGATSLLLITLIRRNR